MHTVEIAKTFGTDLSSRQRAAALRLDITAHTATGINPVTLDFAGVRSVSESFADEAIAVLVAENGEAWFRQHVRLVNLSPSVRLSVLEAVDERCRNTEAAGA
jgi:anti-anti-sigma regulatory factor